MLRRMMIASLLFAGCQPGEGEPTEKPTAGDLEDVGVLTSCESDDQCDGDTCCDGHCSNLSFSALDCDGCGNACGGGEACFDGSCRPAQFAGLCDAKGLIRISNGLGNDDQAGSQIAAAIADACGLDAVTVDQNDGEITDGSGYILPGTGEVLVVPGGIYVSSVALNMEPPIGTAAVTFAGTEGGGGFYRNGDEIVSWDASDIDDEHDFFALQIAPDHTGSRFVVLAAGADMAGTKAAARFFVDRVVADLRGSTERWYVVEWTDDDEDGQPSADDDYEIHGDG